MIPQELLNANGIHLKSYKPGKHATTCPKCSAKRSHANQGTPCLGVKIDDRGATWRCNHCDWTGPEKRNAKNNGHAGDFVATYDYPGFQKVRYPKGHEPRFRIRHREGNDWKWGAGGANTNTLYRKDEIDEAIAHEREIAVVEGERDADNLWAIGIPATCNSQGANQPGLQPKWKVEHSEQLRGAKIVVFNDNDAPGYAHAEATCKLSLGIAARVRRLDLKLHWPDMPEKADVSDWLALPGNNRERLDALIAQAPDYEPAASDGGTEEQHGGDRLITSKASDHEMRGVEWLWPGRLARGKIGLIAGLPDMGKGQIAAFIAAAVTAGAPLPCDEGVAPQGNVIWFNAEDDERDTVKPRLVAAGADTSRIHFVNGAQVNGAIRGFNLVTDLALLRKEIKRIGNVVLVIIDPISAYLGVGKVDGRSATDVRGILTPLKEMTEELHVTLLCICHFNKKDDVKSALLRVSDSIAYVAAARHVYAVIEDPEDKNSKLFAKAKNNLAQDTKALRYGMSVKKVGYDAKLGVDINAPYIIWHTHHVEITANEAMAAAGGHTAKREAREFLLERLEAGPAKADEITEEAKQEGIAEKTLRRAKKELRIKSRREGGSTGDWFWELPARAKTYSQLQ